MLPVLCVIVIINIEFVCDYKSQDTRVKPKLRGFVNCSTNQILIYFIAQGHRHQGRFLFLVFFLSFSDGSEPESRTSDDYTNMTHRVKKENVFFL